MISNVRHTGIVVRDLAKALEFYRDILGFQLLKQMEESGSYLENALDLRGVQVTTIKLQAPAGGGGLELLHFKEPAALPRDQAAANSVGITHIALGVANLDEVYEKLKARGIHFHCPPQKSPDGNAKLSFCRDPEGNLLELVELLRS